jgi:hypothetical protein
MPAASKSMASSFDRGTEAIAKSISPSAEFFQKGAGISASGISDGMTRMITYKIALVIAGASIAFWLLLTFAPVFSADAALAVIACFS